MCRKKGIIVILVLIFGVFLPFVLKSDNASAVAIDTSSTIEKWVFTQYYNCLKYGQLHNGISNELGDTGLVYESIMNEEAEGNYPMPSYNFGNRLNGSMLTCREVLKGKDGGESKGVFDYANNESYKDLKWDGDPEVIESLMTSVGYVLDATSDGHLTIRAKYSQGPIDWANSTSGLGKATKEETVLLKNISVKKDKNTGKYTYARDGDSTVGASVVIHVKNSGNKQKLMISTVGYNVEKGPNTVIKNNNIVIDLDKTNALKSVENIKNGLSGVILYKLTYSGTGCVGPGAPCTVTSNNYYTAYNFNADSADYKKVGLYIFDNNRKNRAASVENLSGGALNLSNIKLTTTERYNLYLHYLDNVTPKTPDRITCDESKKTDAHIAVENIKDVDGKFKTCYFRLNDEDRLNINVYVQKMGKEGAKEKKYPYITTTTIKNIINNFFANVDTDKLGNVWDIESIGEFVKESDAANNDCNSKDLSGQGWILCPVLENSTRTVDMFESLIREWMTFDSSYLNVGKPTGSGAYTAWEIFRNMANVVMILVLLVVIFSQLTGFGIDNYGIKKILPRLIAMAILINLSYIICELLIDLSNIMGVGLDNLFASIGTAINNSGGAGEAAATAAAGAGATVAVAGVVVGAVLAGAGGGIVGMVVALILVLVMALIAILMFFVTLGARLVIILMFTVISPMALACYILPNTQKYFKKWWEIFRTALVVFPICGAVYGLSFVIKAIVFNIAGTDLTGMNFWMAIVAVISPFLPFLMIPTMLKGVLKGLGVLGATIGMLGAGLSKGANSLANGIKSTDRYQNAAKDSRTNMKIRGMERANKKYEDYISGKKDWTDRAFNDFRRKSVPGALALDQREREYETAFSIQSKDANEKIFGQALENKDQAMTAAAWSTLIKQGGLENADKVLKGQDFSKMDEPFREKLMQKISQTAGAGPWQLYAKEVLSGSKLSFDQFTGEASERYGTYKNATQYISDNEEQYKKDRDYIKNTDLSKLGTDPMALKEYTDAEKRIKMYDAALHGAAAYENYRNSVGGKHGSLAAALESRGENAFANVTDDEMKLYGEHANSLSVGLGEAAYQRMNANAMCYNRDGKAQIVASNTLNGAIAGGGITADQLGQVFKANDFGHMTDAIAKSLKKSIETGLNSGNLKVEGITVPTSGGIDESTLTSAIGKIFERQVGQLNSSNNQGSISPEVAKMLGIALKNSKK